MFRLLRKHKVSSFQLGEEFPALAPAVHSVTSSDSEFLQKVKLSMEQVAGDIPFPRMLLATLTL